jgi:hypothetical protein
MLRRRILVTIAVSLLAVREANGQAQTSHDLTGAWRGAVTFPSGAFAGLKGLEYMYVFNAGGTMTESSNYDGVPPVPPAYGVWRKTGARTFEARYQWFQTKAAKTGDALVKDGGFLPDGHGVITQTFTLSADGNSFSSKISVAMFDSSGKPIAGGSTGTASGTRLKF